MNFNQIHHRSAIVLGEQSIDILKNATVAVFGLGGVGSYTVEALARAGIGTLHIIDKDTVDITNINRQLIATSETIGKQKIDVMEKRILAINPTINVLKHSIFFLPENSHQFNFKDIDYVVDAIDTVSAKLELISICKTKHIPIISCMGTGNKLRADLFQIADISKSYGCPLAKIIRKELKKRQIENVKVVFSPEPPTKVSDKAIVGSLPFIPPIAGLMMAGEVILELTKRD